MTERTIDRTAVHLSGALSVKVLYLNAVHKYFEFRLKILGIYF